MHANSCWAHSKLVCFLELPGIFFPQIFSIQLSESTVTELMDIEGQQSNNVISSAYDTREV